jgi:hypothetical protein
MGVWKGKAVAGRCIVMKPLTSYTRGDNNDNGQEMLYAFGGERTPALVYTTYSCSHWECNGIYKLLSPSTDVSHIALGAGYTSPLDSTFLPITQCLGTRVLSTYEQKIAAFFKS